MIKIENLVVDDPTVPEVARIFDCDKSSVYRWAAKGQIEVYDGPDGKKRVRRESLQRPGAQG